NWNYIVARSESTLRESFLALEGAVGDAGLTINEGRTKCMFCGKGDCPSDFFEVEQHRFQSVKKFTYLGSEIECQNEIGPGIRKRIIAANSCLFGFKSQLRSHLIKRRTEILL
ncbi:reverse transcriptase domain-containing protein, partial [Caerostris darwini]